MTDQPHRSQFRKRLQCLAFAVGLLPALAGGAFADTPFLTLPRFAGTSPDLFLSFDHQNGNGQIFDQLRRPASEMRGRRLDDNLFRTIGRAPDQPAIVGELLLAPIFANDGNVRDALFVETSTGYVAFLDEFGKNGKLGTLITVLGRPFGPLAATDGNFALLTRRSDRTEGAYLIHGTTGRGLYLGGLAKLEIDGKVSTTVEVPKMEGRISAAEVLQNQTTVSYLLVDNTSGKAYFLDLLSAPERFNVRPTSLDLVAAFSAAKYNPSLQRFVIEALNDGGSTVALLVIDVASGQIGLVDDPLGSPRLRLLPTNLYDTIRPAIQDTPRTFATVRNGSAGVWVIDSLSATIYYLNSPTIPASTRVEPVSVSR